MKYISKRNVAVTNPKGLNNKYAYTNEVMDMLEKWVVDWINKWYFLENRWLTQRDAYYWIENALNTMNNETLDRESEAKIDTNLSKVKKAIPYSSRTKTLTREDFLNLSYKYLVLDDSNTWKIEYRDIDDSTSKKLSKVFDENTTWKDQFGQKYFRPDARITRWEWAFFLANMLDKTAQTYLTLK